MTAMFVSGMKIRFALGALALAGHAVVEKWPSFMIASQDSFGVSDAVCSRRGGGYGVDRLYG